MILPVTVETLDNITCHSWNTR